MGMMGIDVDAVGNHSFDRGQTYYRTQLLTLADFPVLSSNVVYPDGQVPEGVAAVDGVQVPRRRRPRRSSASRPSRRRASCSRATSIRSRCGRSIPAVNAAVQGCCRTPTRSSRSATRARTAGTVTDPTGPLIDIADGVQGVDVVIGDHNDLQVDALRPNGVLVTENRGKGIRFTRIRIVVGPGKDGVVYKTADYHKPWNIGLTPDPAIQAEDRRT